jgi:hypothetical protein
LLSDSDTLLRDVNETFLYFPSFLTSLGHIRCKTGMSNRGSPEGHMGHICIVMRATLDMRPAGRMFDMLDIGYVFFIQNVFFTLGNSLSYFQV